VANLVGEPPADPGDRSLVSKETVDSLILLFEQTNHFLRRDKVGFRSEDVEWKGRERISRWKTPHPRPSLGPGFGQQQGWSIVEVKPGLSKPRLGQARFLIGEQAAALHEVDSKVNRVELEHQVLASTPNVAQRLPVRLVGCRNRGFQRGELDHLKALQDLSSELLIEPFCVCLNLGDLGHVGTTYS